MNATDRRQWAKEEIAEIVCSRVEAVLDENPEMLFDECSALKTQRDRILKFLGVAPIAARNDIT